MAWFSRAKRGSSILTDKVEGQSESVLKNRIVAFIPARAGSRRVKNKNIRHLNGYPLIAYTIEQAHLAGIFERIYVSTDSTEIANIARKYGAEVIHRPSWAAQDDSPDYEWVHDAILQTMEADYDAYAILRPTNPFRRPSSIQYGWELLKANPTYDSVRAIRPVRDHPCKMWRYHKFDDYTGRITPFLPRVNAYVPAYDMPTQAFDQMWVQSGALQIHWVDIRRKQDITGDKVMGILLGEYESIDINTSRDWDYAEYLAKHEPSVHLLKLGNRRWWQW
jgi:N-acylneuraminate cytidylyltransferase